jgi:DNA-binding transcriptional LysR family regulator
VRLDVEHRQGVIARWQTDDADLMLVLGLDEADNCVVTRLQPLPMRLVVAADHPLADQSVSRDALGAHVELLVRDSSPLVAEGAEAWFGSGHLVHFSDFPTKRVGLLEGLGFGWMPLHLVENDLVSGGLEVISLTDGDAEWTWRPMLVRRADRVQGPASARFEALLLAELGLVVR